MNDVFLGRRESAPGAALTRAREAQNLSVLEVARHLKLTAAQVEALESGDYEKLPGRVFVRGFLRNYAKLVNVEPGPLLRQIESEMPKPVAIEELRQQREVPLPVARRSRWPLFAGIFFLFVAALAVYEFGFNEQGHDRTNGNGTRETTPAQPSEKGGAAATAPVSQSVAPAAAPVAAPAAPRPSPSTISAAPPSSSASSASSIASAPPAPAARPPVKASGERELLFRFDGDAWVEIRDRDNKIIFSKLNRAGAEERVTGAPPLRLVVGNARNVQVTYNAKQVDLTPHIGMTVARLTVE